MRARTGINRFTPDDWINKGKETLVEDERPRRSTVVRRMRSMDDDDEEEEQPQPEARTKIPPKRGRGTRTLRRGPK